MALIVETGSGLANADSYCSLAFADAYAEGLGNPNGWSNKPAELYLLFADNPSDGDTITVDSKAYTFQTTLTDVDGNIQLGADAAASFLNLKKALDLSGVAGTDYATSMTAHSSVKADTPETDRVRFYARASGTAANSKAVSETFSSDANEWDGSTLAGGTARVTVPTKEAALRRATQYLDGKFSLRFKGYKVSELQRLEWPRYEVRDSSDNWISSHSIPEELQRACAELAITTLDSGQPELAPNVTEEAPVIMKTVKAGPVMKKTQFGGGGETPGHRSFQRAKHLLRNLIWPSGQIRRA